MASQDGHSTIGGKISIFAALIGVVIIFAGLLVDIPHRGTVQANVATTSVTVLNTPPTWTIDAQESPASSTSTPTNTGSNVTWTATASDSSGDNWYLIICKTSVMPTPFDGSPPECDGGITNRWARSAATADDAVATAATTTYETDAEFNTWYAWICDATTPGAQCNSAYRQGNNQAASPFVVNHRPVFTLFYNNSPRDPGQLVTWYATASDPDTYGGVATDTVRLFVCKANDFNGTYCGNGGSWGTTSPAVEIDPTATTSLANPYPDGGYLSYGFIVDSHGGHAALGGVQGQARAMVVNNITPTIAAASVSLQDTDGSGPLTLTGMATQTPGFKVQYTIADQNSCQTASSTAEIVYGLTNVYRSLITQTGCDAANEYNPNHCYAGLVGQGVWNSICTASSTSCLGTDDSDVVWTCTFPLWFLADATDGDGVPATDPPYFAQNWLASVQAADNNYATTSLVEGTTGNELSSYLAYNVSTTSIAYGGLQPGQFTSPTIGNNALNRTDLQAWGNVGLDETLYGTDMCTTYPGCPVSATSTIPVGEQRYGTTTISYAIATALLANPGAELEANVKKSIATASPEATTTYWGINVPATITLSGDYTGVNTLVAITGERASW